MKKAIVKRNSNVPAVGSEDVNIQDLSISFIKLVQKTCTRPNTKEGDIIDSVTGTQLGPEVTFIPVKKFIDWVKFSKDFTLDDRSVDGKRWNSGAELTEDERWQCKRLNFFIMVEGEEDSPLPYCLSFGKTSFKEGKRLADITDKYILINKESIYSHKFMLTSRKEKNDKYSYVVFNVELLDEPASEEQMEKAAVMREMVEQAMKKRIDMSQTSDEGPVKNEIADPFKGGVKKSRRF